MDNNDNISAGIVPKQTKSETRLLRRFSAQRFFGLLFTFLVSMLIGIIIGGMMRYVFVVFCLLEYMICTSNSFSDPKKNFVGGLIDFLRYALHKKTFYGPSNAECQKYLEKEEKKREIKEEKKHRQ